MSSPTEIEAIREHVCLYKNNIILWREVPVMSPFQVELFQQKLELLAQQFPSFDLLIDLTGAQHPPDAEIRAQLRMIFKSQRNLHAVAVFTGRNFMLNVAARFVLGAVGVAFSVHSTKEEALRALQYAA